MAKKRPIATNPTTALAGFIRKFAPEHQRLIQNARAALRRRLPTANELVYDNYNFFVIGVFADGATERHDCVARRWRQRCGIVVLPRRDAARSARPLAGIRHTESVHPSAFGRGAARARCRGAHRCRCHASTSAAASNRWPQAGDQISVGEAAATAPRARVTV